MRRILVVIAVATLVLGGAFARPSLFEQTPSVGQASPGENSKVVNFWADVIRPVHVGDSSVYNLLGNVVFFHNGAVITCDSAIRYNDRRMECFGNVIINQDQTYVYGDRADYDGETNMARVYAPIIKMIDGDAIMYTYNFSFNTLDNVGTFSGGATVRQGENRLESMKGYYYADTRDFVCVDEVEVKNPDYMLMSDSVSYNLDNEVATFYVKTYIWNYNGEILSADRGKYFHQTAEYRLTSNAYILTDRQEVWADSLDYDSDTEYAVLKNNIQLRDDEQQVIGFGDYGVYWGEREDALLTRNPSMVTFDPVEDSLYMRADSMFMFSVEERVTIPADSTALEPDGLQTGGEDFGLPETPLPGSEPVVIVTDSLKQNLPAGDEGSRSKQRRQRSEDRRKAREQRRTKATERQQASQDSLLAANVEAATVGDSIADVPVPVSANADLRSVLSEGVYESLLAAGMTEESIQTHISSTPDSTLMQGDRLEQPGETLARLAEADPGVLDSLTMEGVAYQALEPGESSGDTESSTPVTEGEIKIERIIKAYYNVRIFREDFQAVCDSLIGFTSDSTMHMYIEPVLWSDNNQITSEVVDVFTKNEKMQRALFSGGEPMMIAEVDTLNYNQIKGKTIEAFFDENEIYRADVKGNAQTYYYVQDDDTGAVENFMTVESADISFYIGDRKINEITYRGQPVYSIYPMDKIPLTLDPYLPGFVWHSNRRPTKVSVFDREVRPTIRESITAMPQPQFTITEGIDKHRADLVEKRVWADRNEDISEKAKEYIRNLFIR